MSSDQPGGARAGAPTRGQVVAIVSGNALEFYDFLSFSFFAINLGRVMFPANAPGISLLLALSTGALGFFVRPLGAILFGVLGDKLGRRPTMLATFVLMGAGALGLALTPSYAQIGIAAPILVVIFRMLQGLAAGGDVGPTTAYLAECTAPERRGMFSSLQLSAMRAGALLSGIVGLGLSSVMSPAALDSYGWRIAFAIGALIVPFAFLLRRRLEETLHLPECDPYAPSRTKPQVYLVALLGLYGNLLAAGIGDFLHPFAMLYLNADAQTAYLMIFLVATVQTSALVAGGALSDRIGRRPVKIGFGLLGALLSLPLFTWVAAEPSMLRLGVTAVSLAFVVAFCGAASYAAVVDVTPKLWRSRLVGIGYGVAVAVAFGLTAPMATAYLNETADLRTPGLFWTMGFVLMTVSGLLMPETAPRKRGALPAGAVDPAPAGI